MELTAPFAVVVTVEAEVEPGAEVEAGVRHDFHPESTARTVSHGEREGAATEPTVHRVVREVGIERVHRFE